MGVLKFDDVDDRLRWSTLAAAIGNLPTGAWTVSTLFRRETSTTFDALTYLLTGGGVVQAGVSITDSDAARVDTVEAPETTTGLFTNTTGPIMVAVSKAAGTVAPRFHYKIGTGGTWVHTTPATTMPNKSASTVLDVGVWQATSDPFDGWIGLIGYWSGSMSDANVEALSTNWRTSDWWLNAHGTPVFLSEHNVAAASVVDLAGNATALTNTGPTLDAAETLSTWNFNGTGGGAPKTIVVPANAAIASSTSPQTFHWPFASVRIR